MANQNITLDNNLVTNSSGILNSACILNLLWSNYLLTIYGVPTFVDVSIPIPLKERLLIPAGRDLRDSRWIYQNSFIPSHECQFRLSPVPKTFNRLPFLKWPPKTSTRTPAHEKRQSTRSMHIGKSNVLWELPEFQLPSFDPDPDTRTPNIWSASDPRLPAYILGRGRGRLLPEFCHLRTSSPTRYYEAVILLLCRDSDTHYEVFWIAMLTYIMEILDEGSRILSEEDLGEEFRGLYHAVKGGERRMWVVLGELRGELIRKGRLPSVG